MKRMEKLISRARSLFDVDMNNFMTEVIEKSSITCCGAILGTTVPKIGTTTGVIDDFQFTSVMKLFISTS